MIFNFLLHETSFCLTNICMSESTSRVVGGKVVVHCINYGTKMCLMTKQLNVI